MVSLIPNASISLLFHIMSQSNIIITYKKRRNPVMADRERDYTLIYKDEEGNYIELLPKTVAKQVLLANGYTLEDHVNSDYHLLSSERGALTLTNQPNGYVRLNSKGYIPDELVDPQYINVYTEFDDISEMLQASNIDYGILVMVIDATGDPSVEDGWAIYRRKKNVDEYWELTGWDKVMEGESVEVNLDWDLIPGMPNSTPAAIDQMVEDEHTHANSVEVNALSEIDEHLAYKNKKIAFDEEVARFYDTDYMDDETMRPRDFWIKPVFNPGWWTDPTIEDAGATCYEKYRENDTMVTAPKLRTDNVTTVCRMFYRCYDLEEVMQYNLRKCEDYTGQFMECTSLQIVPCMYTPAGKYFDNQFKLCSSLKYSPEMILDNAVSVVGQYSGCENLTRILPFGSTANVTSMKEWFNGCGALKTIMSPIDFSRVDSETGVENMFNDCVDLEKVSFVEGSLHVSLSLANTNLTLESILGIIQGLPEVSTPKMLNLNGVANSVNVDPAVIGEAATKGWTVVTN